MHISVLLTEAIDNLQVQPGNWYLDATFGRGGHTREVLARGGNVVAFDFDSDAITFGRLEFETAIKEQKLMLIRENFAQLQPQVEPLQAQDVVGEIRGALFDFGTSSEQLKNAARGFSFEGEGELDMRMDDRLGVKAQDLLALMSEKELQQLFSELGGEHQARSLAKAIAKQRKNKAITTVQELVNLVNQVKGGRRDGHLHPATKIFQALRIAVNDERNNIREGLSQALKVVKNGRIVTISFHEGEDRIAKQTFRAAERTGLGEMLPLVVPSAAEVAQNPRSRSAKLRVFIKN